MIHQQEVVILVSFLFTMSGKIDKLKKIFTSVSDRKTVHLYVKMTLILWQQDHEICLEQDYANIPFN